MWILPAIALLAGGAQVWALVEGTAKSEDVLVGGIVATIAAGYFFFFKAQRKANEDMLRELSSRRGDLETMGVAHLIGHVINRDAQLRRYTTTISFLLVSVRLQSRLFLPSERSTPMAIVCTLGSLLFGWWGIPWGPIWTIQSVVSNLRGGKTVGVLELARAAATPPL
jgi:hypothetical protein